MPATLAEARKALQDELGGLQSARDTGVLPQIALDRTDIAARELRQKANRRLIALGAAPMPATSLAPPPTVALAGGRSR